MKHYKKKYIRKGFTKGGEWMIKKYFIENGEPTTAHEFEEYIGPITYYADIPHGTDEKLTFEKEKQLKLYPFSYY